MLALKEIRQWIAGLGVAADSNVYIGKLDNKRSKSIGVYGRGTTGEPHRALGDPDCTTYGVRPISILVHWTRSQQESEAAAYELFEKMKNVTNLIIGDTRIDYLRLMVPEPQDVGTDDDGVYEYVIWLDFLYERKR